VILLFLPPYSLERNPVERLWQDMKRKMSGTLHQPRTGLQMPQ
jgi:transposase